MKRKRLPSLIGGVLVAALLLSMVVLPVGVQAAPTTYTALNPLGRIEAPDNQPLAERIGTLAGKTVGLVCWQTSTEGTGRFGGGALFMTGLKATLGAGSYVDRVIGLHFEQKEAWYDELADAVDAVVFAVAEDNMTAYWGAVHVRELEKRGVPCTIVVTNRFEETLKLAAEDHGITALRSVVIDKVDYSNAFYRNETIGGVTFAARQTNLVNVARPGITDALTTALTAAETAPGAIVPQNALADFTYAVGNATSSELGNYAEATAKFNADANAFGFGDGLELILPTRAAVDEMLAATTREPDEILGNIRMRNGVCTIEKVAINAVMAGAKPEYFPVIIAVMEVMAQGAEDYSYYYHALTTGEDYTLLLILNGPLAAELDINASRGYMSAERPANNTIGRAVRMSIRNIGHNIAPYVDTAMAGRINDHAAIVTAEIESPYGRETDLTPHHVVMGFQKTQSTVTVVAVGPWAANDMSCLTTDPYTYRIAPATPGVTPARFDGTNRLNYSASGGDNSGLLNMGYYMLKTRYSGYGTAAYSNNNTFAASHLPTGVNLVPGKDAMVYFMTPAHAKIMTQPYDKWGLQEDGSKLILKDWFTKNGINSVAFAAHNQVAQPFVVGEDVCYMRAFKSSGMGMDAFRTQLITGAAKTAAARGDVPPSQPEDFVALEFLKYYKLKWNAPLRADGSILRYEVSSDGGSTWFDAGLENSYVFNNLESGKKYDFAVRAVSDLFNAVRFDTDTGAKITTSSGRGAQARTLSEPAPSVDAIKIGTASGPAPSMYSAPRNSILDFGTILNGGAEDVNADLAWSTSDPTFAIVDENGLVRILNKAGMATLIVTDKLTGITTAIVLRIT